MNETMDINVRVYPPRKNDPAAAAASVCLNGCFVIRGIRVVEGINGPFVSMPSRKIKNGGKNGEKRYKDTCFPCNAEFRQQFDSAVLAAYQQYRERVEREQAEQAQAGQAEQEVII